MGAIAGVALASFVLQGAPMDKAVHYAATMPGVDGDTIAFVAELAISFISMSACMLAAAEVFLLARESKGPYCAKRRTTEGQPSTNTFEISLLVPPVVVLRRGVDQLGRLAGLLQRRVSILVEDLLIDSAKSHCRC